MGGGEKKNKKRFGWMDMTTLAGQEQRLGGGWNGSGGIRRVWKKLWLLPNAEREGMLEFVCFDGTRYVFDGTKYKLCFDGTKIQQSS